MAAAPPSSIAHPVARLRSRSRAQAAPRQYGTSQPAATLIQHSQAGPPRPNRTRSTSATVTSGHDGCSLATIGVAAVSAAKTSRNHSGDHTSLASVRTVPRSAPKASIVTASTLHTATTAASGLNRRVIRVLSHCPYAVPRRRAEAWLLAATCPPTRKNTAMVCRIQEAGASWGMFRSGLATRTVPLSVTRAVTSQWPSTTPRMAKARSASRARSRPGGVAVWTRSTRSRITARLGGGPSGDDPGDVRKR